MSGNHYILLKLGISIGTIGFILVIASLAIEVYIYIHNLDVEEYRFERIMLAIIGEIILFIGFGLINGSVIQRLRDHNLWDLH